MIIYSVSTFYQATCISIFLPVLHFQNIKHHIWNVTVGLRRLDDIKLHKHGILKCTKTWQCDSKSVTNSTKWRYFLFWMKKYKAVVSLDLTLILTKTKKMYRDEYWIMTEMLQYYIILYINFFLYILQIHEKGKCIEYCMFIINNQEIIEGWGCEINGNFEGEEQMWTRLIHHVPPYHGTYLKMKKSPITPIYIHVYYIM